MRSNRVPGWCSLAVLVTVLFVATAAGAATTPSDLPRILQRDGRHALVVDGAPYLILGAQANNSSNYPAALPKVWPTIEQLHANTVEIPVAWEQIEPQEGKFDFSYLDTLLAQAREHRLRLVLLWFATWKNGSPSYAPEWVKLDNRRFPRVVGADRQPRNSLSPLFPATLDADRRAFIALLRYLKTADPQHTVILVQVENETGTYGAVRDHSATAQKVFQARVPAELTEALKRTPGSWQQVFGPNADEFFHAWFIARFVDQVAAAGKAINPLPMYVNAALRDPFKDEDPSTYSSGGPTWNVLDIWKVAAPAIDVIAPDIYNSDPAFYRRTLEQYARSDNALLVPETGDRPEFARYCFAVLGHGGLGFAPFGMDLTGYANYPLGAAQVNAPVLEAFASNYRLLEPAMRVLARASFAGKLWGAAEPTETHEETLKLAEPWQVHLAYGLPQFGAGTAPGNQPPSGGVLLAELGPDEYLVGGFRTRLNFERAPADGRRFMMARVEEGHFENDAWVFERVWNGDQTDWGLNLTSVGQWLRVKLATY